VMQFYIPSIYIGGSGGVLYILIEKIIQVSDLGVWFSSVIMGELVRATRLIIGVTLWLVPIPTNKACYWKEL
jgi:hypothetical protein